jgi:hypothetical protein
MEQICAKPADKPKPKPKPKLTLPKPRRLMRPPDATKLALGAGA